MSDMQKLRAEFLEESEETLEKLQRDIERLADCGDRPDPEILDRTFRTAHSLKGVCGMFGLQEMTAVSHALESVFEGLRDGTLGIDPAVLELLHLGVDTLHGLLAKETGRGSEGPPAREVIDRIERHLERIRSAAAGGSPSADPVATALEMLSPPERAAVVQEAKPGRTLALVQRDLPHSGFEATYRELLVAVREWGTVHGAASAPAGDDRFRLSVVASGAGEIFHLMRATGAFGVDVTTLDPDRVRAWAAAAGAAPAATPAPPAAETRGATLRVPVERVDRLLSDLGDVVHAKMALDTAAATLLGAVANRVRRTEISQSLRNLDRRIRVLQDEVLRVRMVTLRSLFQKVERATREACRLVGKEARLVTSGESVELDKRIVDALAEPLIHLVRNAVDHGIEDPQARARRGKSPEGTVTLSAWTEAGSTLLEVCDDGAGLDFERILRKGRERGFLTQDAAPTRAELRELVFRPGFTVRDAAGELSGRGVGLDAVRAAVAELGGSLSLEEAEPGTVFRLRIPTTLALVQALLVEAGGQGWFVPLAAILRTVRVPPSALEQVGADEVALLPGEAFLVQDLGAVLVGKGVDRNRDWIHGVVLAAGANRRLLLVDRLGAQREIVVRSLGAALPPIPGIAGSTDLGDGRTVLILDPTALLDGEAAACAGSHS
ncbi:MAG: chemotaxis protein CheA [Candidatus Eiseniibacteriota bacterium]